SGSSLAPGGDLPTDRLIDGAGVALDGFKVEASPRDGTVGYPEDDHPAHLMGSAVWSRSTMLPFAPDDLAVDRRAEDLAGEVRDRPEDLSPVGPHLVPAREATVRMS